jgi:8-oxo-dGTP diphosphatase
MYRLGSFAIIFNEQGGVLLCHRRDMDVWNLPGGHVEQNELPTEAVIRETLEETDLEVEIERLAGIYLKPRDSEFVFSFVCKVIGGDLGPTNEADQLGYFDPSELPVNTPPKQAERIQDAIKHSDPVFRKQEGMSTAELLEKLGE